MFSYGNNYGEFIMILLPGCTRLSFAMTHHILITAKRLGKTLKQNPLGWEIE